MTETSGKEEAPESVAVKAEEEMGGAQGEGEVVDAEAAQGKEKEQEQGAKLPLEHPWTLWFDNPRARSKGNWGASLGEIYTFSTVEDFWCLYNNITTPSCLIPGADLCLFKKGIAPKWEDEKCKKGGKWSLKVPKKQEVDNMWLNTLLALIGEQFEHGEEVCGAVVSLRAKGDRIAIWTKTASDEELQCSVGKQFKELLGVSERIGFMAHEDAKRDDKSAKERYFT